MLDLGAPTVVAALEHRLQRPPSTVATYLVDGQGHSAPCTVSQLSTRIQGYARSMPRNMSGDVVAVCLYHGIELHAAFLGAMWAGHVPTMIAPPSPRMDREKYTRSFVAMLAHVQPRWLVIDAEVRAKLGDSLNIDAGTILLEPKLVPSAEGVAPWPAQGNDIAVLQHSSGTTGLQKGVALSHGAIMRHMRAYASALALSEGDVIASWLPLYHDMGLITSFLLPMVTGIPLVKMSALDWVAHPALLLRKIHEHRATLCWLPNFAYGFLASSVVPDEEPEALDLSCMRAWVNCSEPVSTTAHRKFFERFANWGVNEPSLTVSYAMAENVFAVTQSRPGRGSVLVASRAAFATEHQYRPARAAEDAVELVSNGRCVESTKLRVRSTAGELAPPGQVGEIEIRGEHLFSGYWKRDDLTAPCITSDGWYRTGDLGFVLEDEVYVTGRVKDLIIIQGRNFYPADIEEAVSELDGVTKGRVVAFGVADRRFDTEGLVILAESSVNEAPARARLALAIRKQVAQQFDCTPDDVRVLGERWLIKSTSGKLARGDNRAKYLAELRKGV